MAQSVASPTKEFWSRVRTRESRIRSSFVREVPREFPIPISADNSHPWFHQNWLILHHFRFVSDSLPVHFRSPMMPFDSARRATPRTHLTTSIFLRLELCNTCRRTHARTDARTDGADNTQNRTVSLDPPTKRRGSKTQKDYLASNRNSRIVENIR